MKDKKRKDTMTIRPDLEHKGIIEKMERLAKRDGRSLNNYVLRLFNTHIENEKMINSDIQA